MICLICRHAEIAARVTSVEFQRGEVQLVIDQVPAHVCPSCGEAYIDEAVAARLLEGVDAVYRAGVAHEVIDYKRLCVK